MTMPNSFTGVVDFNGGYPGTPDTGLNRYFGSGIFENLSQDYIMEAVLKREFYRATAGTFDQKNLPQGHKAYQKPWYDDIVAEELNEAEAPRALQRLNQRSEYVSPKRTGLCLAITDEVEFYTQNDVGMTGMALAGRAMGQKENADAISMLAALGNTQGSSTTELTFQNAVRLESIAKHGREFTENRPISSMIGMDCVFVTHGQAIQRFSENTVNKAITDGRTAMLHDLDQWPFWRNYFRNHILPEGLVIMFDDNIKINADNSAVGAIYRRDAITTVRAQMRTPRMEMHRPPGSGTTLFYWNDRYGMGIMDPRGGFSVRNVASALPVS